MFSSCALESAYPTWLDTLATEELNTAAQNENMAGKKLWNTVNTPVLCLFSKYCIWLEIRDDCVANNRYVQFFLQGTEKLVCVDF